jgi:pimeloyl-ACP methyl ester carboxylesterase
MIRQLAILLICLAFQQTAIAELWESVEHHETTNATDQTPIHYVSIGKGPLVVMIHGFPDFWYSWAVPMETLSAKYRCVAMDLRGYNQSGKPEGVESYDMSLLVGDVEAVIRDCGEEAATVIGHDWGGAIAWSVALQRPELVRNLIVCNLPHPRGLKRELLINDEHRQNTQYARAFQAPDAHKLFTPEGLVATLQQWTEVPWPQSKKDRYLEAFQRSDFNAMLHYYRRNYDAKLEDKAALPYQDPTPVVKAKMPVLMFHGLKDQALHHHALNNTWEWVEKDLTIMTLPNAGHWVHHDQPEPVSTTMLDWLNRRH